MLQGGVTVVCLPLQAWKRESGGTTDRIKNRHLTVALPTMNDEHPALEDDVTPSPAVARCGVAIWRLSSKTSGHCIDDDNGVAGSDTTIPEEYYYYSCNNIIPLSEGENWVMVQCAVEDEIMVDGFRDSTKEATTSTTKTSSITIVKGDDDTIVAADDEKEYYSNALLCIDVDNGGPCVTVKDNRTKTTNDNDVDCRPCFYLARRKKVFQCGGIGDGDTMLYRKTSTTRVNSKSPPKEVDVEDTTSHDEKNPSSQAFLYDSSEPTTSIATTARW